MRRFSEPRGPWKAKAVPRRAVVVVYVCAGCRRQSTLLKCGTIYGCPTCVEKAGGRAGFLQAFTERAKTARQELDDALVEAAVP